MKRAADEPFSSIYSKRRFQETAISRAELAMLSDSLANEIRRRLHPMVLREMESIISELNNGGHSLRHRYEPVPGEIHFRDWHDKIVDLLVACDTVITVDFGSALEDGADPPV